MSSKYQNYRYRITNGQQKRWGSRAEREDLIAPELHPGNHLTENENRICYAEYSRGACVIKLAKYFNTSVEEVNNAIRQGTIVNE